MLLHKDSKFAICFGDDESSIKFSGKKNDLLSVIPHLQKHINPQSVIFLKQVHGTDGIIVSKEYKLQSPIDVPCSKGDILLTDRAMVGIGVLTADCLPVVLYDRVNHALGVLHAGWKGSLLGVATRAVNMMKERFHSKPKELEAHFGPSAKSCCYEVQDDFLSRLKKSNVSERCLITKEDKIFFDNAALNKMQLVDIGIKEKNIKVDQHKCTICNQNFCSYRRDKEKASRQFTVAMLK